MNYSLTLQLNYPNTVGNAQRFWFEINLHNKLYDYRFGEILYKSNESSGNAKSREKVETISE